LQPGDYETVEIHGKLVVRFTRDLLDKMISEYKADEDAKTDHEMKPLVLQSRQELRELIVEFTILQLDLDKIRDTDPMFHTLYNEAIHSMAHYAFTQF
jgi:DNA-directed RNA polymerase subunit H (RpoH/RPB5)